MAVYSNMWASQRMRPVGIENVGNTCYRNAAIQILYRIEELQELVDSIDPTYYIRAKLPSLMKQMVDRVNDSPRIIDDIRYRGVNVEEKVTNEYRYVLSLMDRIRIIEDLIESSGTVRNSGIADVDNFYHAYDILHHMFTMMNDDDIVRGEDLAQVSRIACILSPGQRGTQQDAMDTIQQLLDPFRDFVPEVRNLVSTSIALVTDDDSILVMDGSDTKYKIVSIARYGPNLTAPLRIPSTDNVIAYAVRLGAVTTSGHYVTVVQYDGQWYMIDDERIMYMDEDRAMELLPMAYIILYAT